MSRRGSRDNTELKSRDRSSDRRNNYKRVGRDGSRDRREAGRSTKHEEDLEGQSLFR